MIELNYSYDHVALKQVQNNLLNILQELNKICKQNEIEYMLYAGTLIGAVRHKGFIPWDDDLDILMKREHFEKFRDILKNNSDVELVYNKQWVPRLKKKDSSLFIDIFILDNKSTDDKKQRKTIFKLKLFQGMMKPKISFRGKKFRDNLKQVVTYVFGLFLPHRYKLKKYEKISKNHNKQIKDYFISNETFHFLDMTVKHQWVESVQNKEFFGESYPVPVLFDEMLTRIYGDYMNLPPVEKRVPEHLDLFKVNK